MSFLMSLVHAHLASVRRAIKTRAMLYSSHVHFQVEFGNVWHPYGINYVRDVVSLVIVI